jgi:hypothetical protein
MSLASEKVRSQLVCVTGTESVTIVSENMCGYRFRRSFHHFKASTGRGGACLKRNSTNSRISRPRTVSLTAAGVTGAIFRLSKQLEIFEKIELGRVERSCKFFRKHIRKQKSNIVFPLMSTVLVFMISTEQNENKAFSLICIFYAFPIRSISLFKQAPLK